MENWLLIVVGAVFLICIIVGYIRGFLKLGLSLLSTVLTIILVTFLSPYVSSFIEKMTPIDEYIEKRCMEAFVPETMFEYLKEYDLSGTSLSGMSPEELKNLGNLDWDMLGIEPEDILGVIGEIPRDLQIKEIENAEFPQVLKDLLMENNNSTIYQELGVTTFPEYVASYISRLVLNLISFLVTFLISIILVKALMVAVDIIGELPVLGFVNHLCGALLGIVLALVIVWIGFLIMTLAYSTEMGHLCFQMIEESKLLSMLYNANPLLIRLLGFY